MTVGCVDGNFDIVGIFDADGKTLGSLVKLGTEEDEGDGAYDGGSDVVGAFDWLNDRFGPEDIDGPIDSEILMDQSISIYWMIHWVHLTKKGLLIMLALSMVHPTMMASEIKMVKHWAVCLNLGLMVETVMEQKKEK